jgi:hypothetical protein
MESSNLDSALIASPLPSQTGTRMDGLSLRAFDGFDVLGSGPIEGKRDGCFPRVCSSLPKRPCNRCGHCRAQMILAGQIVRVETGQEERLVFAHQRSPDVRC